jgi:hypothetical protein
MQCSNTTKTIISPPSSEWTDKQELIAYFCSRNDYHKNDSNLIKYLAYLNNLEPNDLKNKCKNYDYLFGQKGDNNCHKKTIITFVKYSEVSDKKIIEILTDKSSYQRKISTLEDLSKYDFNEAEILDCKLNKISINFKNLHQILNQIYLNINNVKKIIEGSVLKIYPRKTQDKSYHYLSKLDISVEKSEMNQTLLEIIHQCQNSNIKLSLKIKIQEENLLLRF